MYVVCMLSIYFVLYLLFLLLYDCYAFYLLLFMELITTTFTISLFCFVLSSIMCCVLLW